jgi:predicted nucleic acid-binding protein
MGLRRQRITPLEASSFLESIRNLRIQLVDPVSCDRVFDLAVRHRLTFYDAAYLDLALREALPLASLDDALCDAARASDVPIFRPQSIP